MIYIYIYTCKYMCKCACVGMCVGMCVSVFVNVCICVSALYTNINVTPTHSLFAVHRNLMQSWTFLFSARACVVYGRVFAGKMSAAEIAFPQRIC